MKFRVRIIGAVLALALGAAGCRSMQHPATPTLSFEGRTAVYGRQVIAGVREAAAAVDQHATLGILPAADARRTLEALAVATVEAQRLADVLLIVDQARDEAARTKGVEDAAVVIRAVQRAVNQALLPVGPDERRAGIAMALGQVSDLLITVAVTLPATAGN